MSNVLDSAIPVACWSCHVAQNDLTLFCSHCSKIQPAAAGDFFQVFGLKRAFHIDLEALEREFHRLSRRLHPDRFARSSGQERDWSLANTALLNDAYRTLKDPIKRTEYLLRLEGVELGEQSSQATEEARATGKLKKQVVPPDLLEEVFELNMHLEELRTQKKTGEDDPALLEEIGKAKLSLDEKYDALFNELKAEWNKWDKSLDDGTQGERQEILDKILDVLNRRNYVRNLVRDVNEALE